MTLNFDQPLLGFDGAPISVPMNPGQAPSALTLKSVAISALQNLTQEDANLSGEDKCKRNELARKIYNDSKDFSVEELGLIKKLIGVQYIPAIVGAAWLLLEGKPMEAPVKLVTESASSPTAQQS